MKIITAGERMAERGGIKAVILGPSCLSSPGGRVVSAVGANGPLSHSSTGGAKAPRTAPPDAPVLHSPRIEPSRSKEQTE